MQMNYSGKSKYKAQGEGGGPYAKHAQSNFDGGRTTKKGGTNRSRPQVNFDVRISIPSKFESGQGQKSGTGNNNGF